MVKDGKLSGAPSSQNRHCQSRAMAAIPTVKGSALERGRVVGGAKMDDWGGGWSRGVGGCFSSSQGLCS